MDLISYISEAAGGKASGQNVRYQFSTFLNSHGIVHVRLCYKRT
jgi:hypothetical protein